MSFLTEGAERTSAREQRPAAELLRVAIKCAGIAGAWIPSEFQVTRTLEIGNTPSMAKGH